MADDGFHVGAGMLESPMGNARLPLAGYELVGHEQLPWIEQVGTLLRIEEQLQTVSLTVDLPYIVGAFRRSNSHPNRSGSDCWCQHRQPALDATTRRNGFLRSVARRMVEAGHGVESNELMAAMVESHSGMASERQQGFTAEAAGWCRRWLKWAMTRLVVVVIHRSQQS